MFRTRIPRRNLLTTALRMLTSSNVRLFVLGGLPFFHTIILLSILLYSFISVMFNTLSVSRCCLERFSFTTDSLEPSKRRRLSFGLECSVRACV